MRSMFRRTIMLAFTMQHQWKQLIAEVLELAGNAARDSKKSDIIPRYVLLAVRNDDLGKLLAGVTISSGGVLPNINFVLLPNKSEEASKSQKKD
ncbi:histone H2A.1-like [Magnolia sinica]|uniref:histone H2A.1-like n=1 Tax=Magnolia sinica TaxID=86752 RepID=UPI00265AAC10|nr:histone H2A.1-like [Magnolia sinica]